MENFSDVFDVINKSKKVGMFQFVAGIPGGNYSKKYYVETFLPTSLFLKELTLNNKDKTDKFNYKNIKNTYIDYDMFIDPQEVLRFDFAPQNIKNISNKVDNSGIVLLDDPFKTKNALKQNNNYKYLYPNKYNDTASRLMVGLGACPKRNPLLRRIVGFEIAKALYKDGYKIGVLADGKLILDFPVTVSGVIGDWIRRSNRAFKKAGKNVEKALTTPIRNYLKTKLPAVWGPINWVDKRLGVTSSLIKLNQFTVDLANKYGEQVALIAGNVLLNIYAPGYGKYIMTAIKFANSTLGKKQKKAIENVVELGAKASPIDKEIYKETMATKLMEIKSKLILSKGEEGKKDFEKLVETVKETMVKSKEEIKEIEKEQEKKYARKKGMDEDVDILLSGCCGKNITVYPFYNKFNAFARLILV